MIRQIAEISLLLLALVSTECLPKKCAGVQPVIVTSKCSVKMTTNMV